jgi:protein subunit release factor A
VAAGVDFEPEESDFGALLLPPSDFDELEELLELEPELGEESDVFARESVR